MFITDAISVPRTFLKDCGPHKLKGSVLQKYKTRQWQLGCILEMKTTEQEILADEDIFNTQYEAKSENKSW